MLFRSARLEFLEHPHHGRAVHDGHHHVGQDGLDGILVLGVDGKGLDAVAAGDDFVAIRFKEVFGSGEDASLVIHNENGFAIAAWEGFLRGLGVELGVRRGGEEAGEGRALVDFAVDVEETAVALDDPEDGGQSEAGALAVFLGGEERVEDLVENLLDRKSTRLNSSHT